MLHNHVWRDTQFPTAKKNKEDLYISIKNSKEAGFWLKGEEVEFGKQLREEKKIILCCGGKAATAI